MRRGLVGDDVDRRVHREQLRHDHRGVAEQADREALARVARLDRELERVLDAVGPHVEVAVLDAARDGARVAVDADRDAVVHRDGERLRATHAAEAGGQGDRAGEGAAEVLLPHGRERLVGALQDALGADVDPRAGGHLAVHREAEVLEAAELLPVGPVADQVGVRDEHARRPLVRGEDADRTTALHEHRLVALERAQRALERVERRPVARGLAGAAVDDELVGVLGDLGVEVVLEHPQRGLLLPALRGELGAAGGTDGAGTGDGGRGHEDSWELDRRDGPIQRFSGPAAAPRRDSLSVSQTSHRPRGAQLPDASGDSRTGGRWAGFRRRGRRWAILSFLATRPGPVGATTIARELDLPRSTTYHLLAELLDGRLRGAPAGGAGLRPRRRGVRGRVGLPPPRPARAARATAARPARRADVADRAARHPAGQRDGLPPQGAAALPADPRHRRRRTPARAPHRERPRDARAPAGRPGPRALPERLRRSAPAPASDPRRSASCARPSASRSSRATPRSTGSSPRATPRWPRAPSTTAHDRRRPSH